MSSRRHHWLLPQEGSRPRGVVYYVGAGDEPSSCMELTSSPARARLRIVAAGKGKNNAFNRDAVPEDYREEAIRRNMNPRMWSSCRWVEAMVEMACSPTPRPRPGRPGMHGPTPPATNGQGADPQS